MLRDEYWQVRNLIAAHTKENIDLLAVKAVRYAKIRQFYDTSCINYEAQRAMKGHTKVEGLVLPTLAKLPGIKADLTRNDGDWYIYICRYIYTQRSTLFCLSYWA